MELEIPYGTHIVRAGGRAGGQLDRISQHAFGAQCWNQLANGLFLLHFLPLSFWL